jgi:hypothetical protein
LFIVRRLPRQRKALINENQVAREQINNNPSRLEWWVWVLPALAALIIDIYFI